MAEIKAIEGRSVHQIQSGQVISDGLCSAVKELIENSIDAHATSIEVRFKNHGLELIEVSDNGDGITPDNFDKLALKHYTSKLRTYEDLEKVTTYGFRGEALSSLCALSTLSITTATADVAPKGTRIEFHVSGVLKSTSVTSHPRGTTVSVETLFKNLPVRKQELERNIKREFARVVSFLQAYAIVCVGVKFTVYNRPAGGKKTLLFSTKANKTTKENIANVFGARALLNLVPLDLDFEMTATVSVLNRGRDDTRKVKIVGHISRPVVGEGRQAPDRQLFFVNSRPCNLPQVARAINEVYKTYNLTQSPFVFADLQLDTNAYDVNVSPDKRTILLHDQANLLESLKASLTDLFDNQEQTVPAVTQSKLPAFKPLTVEAAKVPAKRPIQEVSDNDEEDETDELESSGATEEPVRSRYRVTGPIPRGDGHLNLTSNLHSNQTIDRKDYEHGKRARTGLTYEQKGKIAKAFAARSASNVEEGEEGENVDQATTEAPLELDSAQTGNGDGEIEGHPLSQASPQPWRRSSPHPTTITIGNHTVTSTPKRSPSKVFPILSSSPTKRLGPRRPQGSFARKLQGFTASGTQSSLSLPEDDIEELDEETEEAQETLEADSPAMSAEDEDHHVSNKVPQIQVEEEDEEDEEEGPLEEEATVELREEVETEPLEQHLDIIIDSEPWTGPSSAFIRSSPPPLNKSPQELIDSILEDTNGVNMENGTEEQHQEQERRRVDDLIARAESSSKRSTPQLSKPSVLAKVDLKDSTHSLVQKMRPLTLDSIRTLSKTLRQPLLSQANTSDNKKGKAKLVKLDSQEEKSSVEERLSLTIAKSDFAKMQIAGQFNLGFILATRLSEKGDDVNDLFIIDQHASDEKYNFERLQAETVVQNQPMVRPKVLELSAMDELVVMDNLDVLKKNGFVVEIDDEGNVGRRCKLVSLPMSKDKVFDMQDFEELLHLIHEHPNDNSVRPSKVRAMFAMRACRSSIMIGRTLGLKDMKKVVKHMGELDKPWNCPHGRPTMRHLCDVGQLECWADDQERAFADDDEELHDTQALAEDEEMEEADYEQDDEEEGDDMEEEE
ncbi:hypothetical protein ABW19_dt0208735 [Dactylella cylindrospora]|nr:hypothetical protein ABW19_dt0208735 [Dactylella cylindrospora]